MVAQPFVVGKLVHAIFDGDVVFANVEIDGTPVLRIEGFSLRILQKFVAYCRLHFVS